MENYTIQMDNLYKTKIEYGIQMENYTFNTNGKLYNANTIFYNSYW
jgi:hypothetical protein